MTLFLVFKIIFFSLFSLSLQPFESPVATSEGVVFDLIHIVPYITKHGTSPVTGKVQIFIILIHLLIKVLSLASSSGRLDKNTVS